MLRILIPVLILGSTVLSGSESWADFEVLDVALAGSIQNRQPKNPVRPTAHCEKDKNGEGKLPVIDSAVLPKVFFWTRIASSSKGSIRHTWHQQLQDGWETVSVINLPIRPSPGYRMWSAKAFLPGDPVGDWMIVVTPSHDPQHVLCITRFSVK